MTCICKKETPFWDNALPMEQRLDWLLKEMTLEEKLQCLAGRVPDLERIGIPGIGVGGEAAHGVEARNDQNKLGAPDKTTSFVQPIGMSATWDPELLEQAGAVTGTEARVLHHKHPGRGLSRWAPTVDLERDPRWGRNEEGYGEDPCLTGEMASAYIRGMQGNHPKYLRIAATLKHFYANNTERGRIWKSATVDPRNKYEYYLESFRRCIEKGKAEAVMTAYNKINGTTGMLNPEVKNILKKQYGLHHVVCDGGAMVLVANVQHYFGSHAETLAASIKSGVDSMSDNAAVVAEAAKEAYELGLLSIEDIEGAIRNMFATKLRLGVYDRIPSNPYDLVTEEDLICEKHDQICRQVSKEAVVLLKNQEHALPLAKPESEDALALIGPLADRWYQDWYGGEPAYRTTLKQGIQQVTGQNIPLAEGYDRIRLMANGRFVAQGSNGRLRLAEEGDVFLFQDWGEGRITLQNEKTGLYMNIRRTDEAPDADPYIYAEKQAPFDWFVLEIFHFIPKADGTWQITTRFEKALDADQDGVLFASEKEAGISFSIELVEDGLQTAKKLATEKKHVILALGCNSMVNAKEEIDRDTLDLPPAQQKLLEEIYAVNPNITLVIFSNYPYTMTWAQEKIPAILWSATGAQDMGLAMAETIFGENAPAGRLNMTWPMSMDQLPDIDDYDIIQGKRTYRYMDQPVLYPFGHGLTYTVFTYQDLKVNVEDYAQLKISLTLKNTGSSTSDEVVQIYAGFPKTRVKRPIRQLLAWKREKAVKPGEERSIEFTVSLEELRFYDVISRRLLVEKGTYQIYAGPSSAVSPVSAEVFVPGETIGTRNLQERIAADHYDTCEQVILAEGIHGFTAACVKPQMQKAKLVYGNFLYRGEEGTAVFYLRCKKQGSLTVYVNDKVAGSFSGDTIDYDAVPPFYPDQRSRDEAKLRSSLQKPIFTQVQIPLDLSDLPLGEVFTLALEITGDAELCWFKLNC